MFGKKDNNKSNALDNIISNLDDMLGNDADTQDNGISEVKFTHTMKTFTTSNRALEQYLFMHRIRHQSWHRDENGLTVWTYNTTKLLIETINNFLQMEVYGTGWDAKT